MAYDLVPLNVGDIIERFFGLLGRTFQRLAGIFLLVGVPAAVVMAVSMDTFFSSLVEIVNMSQSGPTNELLVQAAIRGFGLLLLGVGLLLVADVTVLAAGQLVVCGEIVGRKISVREAFELTTISRLGRALGQRILGEIGSGLAIVGPYLLIPVAIATNAGGGIIALVILIFLLAFALFLYLRVRWAYGTTTIVWEEESVFGAFTRSGYLVSDSGWRLFLIMAVFAILIGIALSMLMMPFQLWVFKDLFLLGLQESARTVSQQSPINPMDMLSGIGFAYGLVAGGATVLQTLLKSIYLPVLYFDLRARKGEFELESGEDLL